MLAIRQLALSGRGFTVDHIRDMAGEPEDPHYWGALFAAAQKLKIIEAVGARVGRDGQFVSVWWGLPHMTAAPPNDEQAERALLGHMLDLGRVPEASTG